MKKTLWIAVFKVKPLMPNIYHTSCAYESLELLKEIYHDHKDYNFVSIEIEE